MHILHVRASRRWGTMPPATGSSMRVGDGVGVSNAVIFKCHGEAKPLGSGPELQYTSNFTVVCDL